MLKKKLFVLVLLCTATSAESQISSEDIEWEYYDEQDLSPEEEKSLQLGQNRASAELEKVSHQDSIYSAAQMPIHGYLPQNPQHMAYANQSQQQSFPYGTMATPMMYQNPYMSMQPQITYGLAQPQKQPSMFPSMARQVQQGSTRFLPPVELYKNVKKKGKKEKPQPPSSPAIAPQMMMANPYSQMSQFGGMQPASPYMAAYMPQTSILQPAMPAQTETTKGNKKAALKPIQVTFPYQARAYPTKAGQQVYTPVVMMPPMEQPQVPAIAPYPAPVQQASPTRPQSQQPVMQSQPSPQQQPQYQQPQPQPQPKQQYQQPPQQLQPQPQRLYQQQQTKQTPQYQQQQPTPVPPQQPQQQRAPKYQPKSQQPYQQQQQPQQWQSKSQTQPSRQSQPTPRPVTTQPQPTRQSPLRPQPQQPQPTRKLYQQSQQQPQQSYQSPQQQPQQQLQQQPQQQPRQQPQLQQSYSQYQPQQQYQSSPPPTAFMSAEQEKGENEIVETTTPIPPAEDEPKLQSEPAPTKPEPPLNPKVLSQMGEEVPASLAALLSFEQPPPQPMMPPPSGYQMYDPRMGLQMPMQQAPMLQPMPQPMPKPIPQQIPLPQAPGGGTMQPYNFKTPVTVDAGYSGILNAKGPRVERQADSPANDGPKNSDREANDDWDDFWDDDYDWTASALHKQAVAATKKSSQKNKLAYRYEHDEDRYGPIVNEHLLQFLI